MTNGEERIKELEQALIDIYQASWYDLNERTEFRQTHINNDVFVKICDRVGLDALINALNQK